MRVFVARIQTRRTRTVRMVAASAEAATRAAGVLLGQDDRLLSVEPLAEKTSASAMAALRGLMARHFLALDGDAATVGDWIAAALVDPLAAEKLNPQLAMAGLRVAHDPERVIVGSPVSIPLLGEWFQGSEWAGSALIQTLAAVPGAIRRLYSMAGVKTRCVVLPFAEVAKATI